MSNIEKNTENLLSKIQAMNIPEINKKFILGFYKECRVNGLMPKTIYSYLKPPHALAIKNKKPFNEVTREDVVDFFTDLKENGYEYKDQTRHHKGQYSPYTLEVWKVIIKKFFKFVEYGTTNDRETPYPECVSWIRLKNKYNYKLPEDMLSQEEVKKMVDVCDNQRDKALITVLYESACRVGELLNVKMKNLSFDEYGCKMVVSGKTGQRPIRLIISEAELKKWIECHPDKDNPNAFLWISIGKADFGKPLGIPGTQKRLKVLAKRAGINKNVYPHLFRHSRITEMAGEYTEADLRTFAGWTGTSDMPTVYIHRSGTHFEEKYLRMHGKIREKKRGALEPVKCPVCDRDNPMSSRFCVECGIDMKNIAEIEKQKRIANNWMNKLLQIPEVKIFLSEKIEELVNNVD